MNSRAGGHISEMDSTEKGGACAVTERKKPSLPGLAPEPFADRILQMYDKGISLMAIGESLQLSAKNLRDWIRDTVPEERKKRHRETILKAERQLRTGKLCGECNLWKPDTPKTRWPYVRRAETRSGKLLRLGTCEQSGERRERCDPCACQRGKSNVPV